MGCERFTAKMANEYSDAQREYNATLEKCESDSQSSEKDQNKDDMLMKADRLS